MKLPVLPPIEPMLAKAVPEIPTTAGMTYEPKWDGFRCIIFRDGDEVELASRGGKTMTRYFPEVVDQVRAQFPERCVVDAELVVIRHDTTPPKLDFELLGQRIHPAASRVAMLAETIPASIIAFDLLAVGDELYTEIGYARRRALLEKTLANVVPPVHLTAITKDVDTAREWFQVLEGAGLDGLIAKPPEETYQPGKRVMYKIKHARTADVVVAGFRWHKDGEGVGSMLLGLFDDRGELNHVGVAASFAKKLRSELVDELAPYKAVDLTDHPWRAWAEAEAHDGTRLMPGTPSRWNGQKDLTWVPLRPERVVEVRFENLLSGRFRGVSRFVRWREDKRPEDCTYAQLDEIAPAELAAIFG